VTAYRQIRIAYVNHTGAVSGAERVLVEMVRGLDRTRYEPVVICPADSDLTRLMEAECVRCVPMPAVNARFSARPVRLWKSVASYARAVAALRATLSRLRSDIVHANSLRAGLAVSVAAIGMKAKVVWHIHDMLPRHPLSAAIRLFALLLRPTRIVAVSEATAHAFRGSFSFKGRVLTMYNGVDLTRFPKKGSSSPGVRGAMGVPEDAFMVCAVGQICARKGLLELLDAFEQMYAAAPGMHLVIAGKVVFVHEEKYFGSLLRAVAEPGLADRVHFAGEVRDVSGLLQAADLMVLNSREEPFGLVLVEAMSSGTAVLATRVGGIPEIVEDSKNGWLIEKSDTRGLAKKLLELSQDRGLLKKVAQTALDETCSQFSLERFHSRLQRFYSELAPRSGSAIGAAHTIGPWT
jgi:L-malate glycosyltransferase